nr:MAG TPA: hypothetical protein [Caudoviricetes sp.]
MKIDFLKTFYSFSIPPTIFVRVFSSLELLENC